jgi:hypothetical protein
MMCGDVQDVKYVEDKLKDLMNIATEAILSIDKQVNDLEQNITALERQTEEENPVRAPSHC